MSCILNVSFIVIVTGEQVCEEKFSNLLEIRNSW